MARPLPARELTPARTTGAEFTVATPEDDAEIRRLLRDNPMPGPISLSLQREPNYFADANWPGQSRQTIVCKEGNRVVCMGNCTVQPRFVNGQPCRVGYLGGLRLDSARAGRSDVVRRGYKFFQQLQEDNPADFYFTSIVTGNERARQFLERNLPGMPRYEFIGDFVTVVLNAPNGSESYGKDVDTGEFVKTLNEHNGRYQFAPCWSEEELTVLKEFGLRLGRRAALWDQRSFKQTVVSSYSASLAWTRPLINLASRCVGSLKFPEVGEALATAYISHLSVEPDRDQALIDLIHGIDGKAARINYLILGFAANDPRLRRARFYFHTEYHSRLYLVSWPGCGGSRRELDNRILAPEVALL